MTQRDEAERLAEYDEQLSAICGQVPKYAPVLRSMAAEIERKDALLREALAALEYHVAQTRPIYETGVAIYNIETELGGNHG